MRLAGSAAVASEPRMIAPKIDIGRSWLAGALSDGVGVDAVSWGPVNTDEAKSTRLDGLNTCPMPTTDVPTVRPNSANAPGTAAGSDRVASTLWDPTPRKVPD